MATNIEASPTIPKVLYGLLGASVTLNLVLLVGGAGGPRLPMTSDLSEHDDGGLTSGGASRVVAEHAIPKLGTGTNFAGTGAAAAGTPASGAGAGAAPGSPAGGSAPGSLAPSLVANAEASAGPATAGPAAESVPGPDSLEGWEVLRGAVDQSLARTFQREAGADGDALSSVYTRLFVWDLDLRRDLQAGDSVSVVWRKASDGLPEVAAASLGSKKLGKTIAGYRWQAPGDAYPSYWQLDGTEVPLRLREGPLEHYEQITSLLKDRPTHKGMDFKTPVGTEVRAPKAGVVTRVNWNWKANGNCLEVRFDDGVLAKFLHLSENRVAEGQRVAAGQVIALTGNTGHTTAPHLHYQLDRGSKTLDPLDYHGTARRTLSAEQLDALERDVAALAGMLAGGA